MGYSDPRWERALKPNPSEPILYKEPKIKRYIKNHSFIKDYIWFEHHIRHEEWLTGKKENEFYMIVHDFDGIKPIKVKIKFKYYPNNHIWVHHSHVLKNHKK